VLCCGLLTSCFDPVQLNQRAIVQAAGIDLSEEGDVLLCLQLFSPEEDEDVHIVKASGRTLSQAARNAALAEGRQLFAGQCRTLLIGKALAQAGVSQILSAFASLPSARQSVYVALAEEDVSGILEAQKGQALERMLEKAGESGQAQPVRLYQFLRELSSGYESALLPVLAEKASAFPEEANLTVSGAAAFSPEGALTETFTEETARGLLWIQGGAKGAEVTVSTPAFSHAVLRVYEARASLTPEPEELAFHLKITCKAAAGEQTLKGEAPSASQALRELQSAGEAKIAADCRSAFARSTASGADVLHLGDLIWQRSPQRWASLRESWQERLPDASLTVEVKMEVDETGTAF